MKSAAAIIVLSAAALGTACSTPRPDVVPATAAPAPAPFGPRVMGGTPADMPRATVYRMSGDYSCNVPITIGTDGEATSYPAPSDLSETSMPVDMGGGLWLDRRGVGLRSVFTRYTYAEYMALPQAPAPQRLRRAVIPGARVTAVYPLPMAIGADSAEVADYIATHPDLF